MTTPYVYGSCAHKNITDYDDSGGCGTPLCNGWTEYHCRDCNMFLASCPCGFCNGESGWPWKRLARTDIRSARTWDETLKEVKRLRVIFEAEAARNIR